MPWQCSPNSEHSLSCRKWEMFEMQVSTRRAVPTFWFRLVWPNWGILFAHKTRFSAWKTEFHRTEHNTHFRTTTHTSHLVDVLVLFCCFFFPAGNLKAFWKCRDKKWSNKPSHQGAGSPRDPSSLHQHPKGWSPPGGWLKPGQAGKVSGQQPFWNWLSAS